MITFDESSRDSNLKVTIEEEQPLTAKIKVFPGRLGSMCSAIAFATVALMLSLLIFIGEAVRDAFDPRKTFS